jgi:hypothetical protein
MQLTIKVVFYLHAVWPQLPLLSLQLTRFDIRLDNQSHVVAKKTLWNYLKVARNLGEDNHHDRAIILYFPAMSALLGRV